MRDPQYMYLDYLLIFNWAEILRTTSSTGAHARHWCTQLYILCIGPIYTTQGFSFYSNAIFWKLFLAIKRSKEWILMHVFNTYIYDIRLYVHCAYMWLCVHIWDHNPILVKFLDKESGKNSNGLVSAMKKLPYGVLALIRGGLHQLGSLLTGVKAMQRVIKLTYIKRPKKSLKKLVRPSMISFGG